MSENEKSLGKYAVIHPCKTCNFEAMADRSEAMKLAEDYARGALVEGLEMPIRVDVYQVVATVQLDLDLSAEHLPQSGRF